MLPSSSRKAVNLQFDMPPSKQSEAKHKSFVYLLFMVYYERCQ